MDLVMVIIRTVFFYVFVLIIFRLMGKREIGELSIQDLVVSLLIAELVAISIENYKDSMLLTVIPILILLFFEVTAIKYPDKTKNSETPRKPPLTS